MTSTIMWLFIGVLLYWVYCIFWGVKGFLRTKTAGDYFIAGRALPMWVFILAATATSFSGWTFVGHPGSIYAGGLPYAFAGFYAITIPFTGMLFLRRQWVLGKKFGFITPGEMYAAYYGGEAMRVLTVVVALVFSVPYLAVQLMASGFLFEILTDGLVPYFFGALALSAVVFFYVAAGGLRSVALVDCLQCILLMLGITILGVTALGMVGGWESFSSGLRSLAEIKPDFFEVPGLLQTIVPGGPWTALMILTYMFALMGIQSSPAFSMWAFSNRDPRPFPIQQAIVSSLIIGGLLIVFSNLQGLSGRILGLDLAVSDRLVPTLIHALPTPILVFTAIAALAAMQSTGAAYMSTASGILTRDIFVRYVKPDAGHQTQVWFGRGAVLLVVVLAFLVSAGAYDALVLLGGLAVAYGLQLYPALIGVLYWRRLTRQGVVAGLIVGLLAVSVTYLFPEYRYPLTIHSAGWGIFLNVLVAVLVSLYGPQPTAEERARREEFHRVLRETCGLTPHKKKWMAITWVFTIFWFVMAIGPGTLLGSNLDVWIAGVPLLWVWQIIWWLVGVGMMIWLCFYMEMSTMPKNLEKVLTDEDQGPSSIYPGIVHKA